MLIGFRGVKIIMLSVAVIVSISSIGCAYGGSEKLRAQESRATMFGVMSEMNNPDYVYSRTNRTIKQDAKKRGIEFWSIVFRWSEYEGQKGRYNKEYVNKVKKQIDELIKFGYKIEILTVLSGNPPEWVWRIPNAKYKNQSGQEFDEKFERWNNYPFSHLNIIFNPQIRGAVSKCISEFFKDFSNYTDKIRAVYTDTGGGGDSVYPYVIDDDTNSWWAFDENAQNQKNPGSLAGPYPVPGWKPGDADPEKAKKFYDWYIDSALELVEWQIKEFRRHYKGKIKAYSDIFWNHHNVTDADIEAAIASNLDGSAPESIWRLSAGYSKLYAPLLAKDPNVIPHHTAVEAITDQEVKFMRKYFKYLSGENSDFADLHPTAAHFDGKGTMDKCFENIKRFRLNEFRWSRDIELYKHKNPGPEYYERKIMKLK